MFEVPDRVAADLNRYERQQRDAALESPAYRRALFDAAEQDICDYTCLATILEDTKLAAPLAWIMRDQSAAIGELESIKAALRLHPHATAAIESLFSAVSALQRALVNRAMGEE